MTRSPADAARDLGAAASELATALYTLDNAPDMVFVRTQSDGGNVAAEGVIASLGLAWERYTLLKEAVDALDSAVTGRRGPEIDRLLSRSAVTLPDGTTIGIAQLVEDIELRVQQIEPRFTALAGAARQAVVRLDTAQLALRDIRTRARAVGAEDDVEVTALGAAVDRALAEVSADPTKADNLGYLDQAVAVARQRVETLEQHRHTVPAALAAAHAQLDEIEAAVERAEAALALTRTKIGNSPGLQKPPNLAAEGDRALRPWLARLQAQADSGELEAAAAGLVAWKAAADACQLHAEQATKANAAPLARRNELRGLLDAYRAKAAALGRDEDGQLARLYDAARDVLYIAPCPLPTAEALVRQYVAAVNTKSRAGTELR